MKELRLEIEELEERIAPGKTLTLGEYTLTAGDGGASVTYEHECLTADISLL